MSEERIQISRPPLSLLFDPALAKSKKPWEIDISRLLELFVGIVTRSNFPDLRLCGSAALSSALIYRLKVETLFLFERLRAKTRPGEIEEPPRILVMPFRYELRSTTIEELVTTLEVILQELLVEAQKQETYASLVEPREPPDIDKFVAQISGMVSSFKSQLSQILLDKSTFLFSEYSRGFTVLERVRAFILFLFVAMEGIVTLEQVGDDDILITKVNQVVKS